MNLSWKIFFCRWGVIDAAEQHVKTKMNEHTQCKDGAGISNQYVLSDYNPILVQCERRVRQISRDSHANNRVESPSYVFRICELVRERDTDES